MSLGTEGKGKKDCKKRKTSSKRKKDCGKREGEF
jgi:hypothetical protein